MELGVLALVFVLGACVGSFLNVFIFRYGFREHDAPRSACMACNGTLGAYDLIPLVSYVLLGGRCRRCGSGISAQYPLVELGSGILFVLSYLHMGALSLGLEVVFALTALFWVVLLALVVYDIRHTLMPLPLIGVLAALAFGAAVARSYALSVPISEALIGAAVCGGFFALLVAITRGRGMGIGDAYVAAVIGMMLGLEQGVVASMLAVWIGTVVGLTLIVVQSVFQRSALGTGGARVTLQSEIPFAPFLALGALIAWEFSLGLSAFGISLPLW